MQPPQRDQRLDGYQGASPRTGSPPLGPGSPTGTKHHHWNGHGPALDAPSYTKTATRERLDPRYLKFTALRGRTRRRGYPVPLASSVPKFPSRTELRIRPEWSGSAAHHG